MRFRLLWAVFTVIPIVVLSLPAVLTYTFLAGERGTAQVSECRRVSSGRIVQLNCTGTWRTDGGDTGSGKVYGLSREDVGRTVEVRIGPLGPYAHGFAGSWHVYAYSPFIFIMFGVLLAGRRKAVRRAAPLLAGPASHGDLLIVTGTGARTPDKHQYASVVSVPRPPVPLPAGMKASHWEVRGHGGQPMFRVEKCDGKKVPPEFALLDLSGAPRVIVRNAGTSPASYAILYPDGTPAGRIELP